MNIRIIPKTLVGNVKAITSKSHAHRLLIAAALAQDAADVEIDTTSVDIETTRHCLEELRQSAPVFDCKESGSTLRFLLPLAMVQKNEAAFTGSGRLPQRPISPLKEEMEKHGCTFSKGGAAVGESTEICRVKGPLNGGIFTLPGNISSQYITGLLFALPLLEEDSKIVLTSPLESASYVALTIQVLDDFGIAVSVKKNDGLLTFEIGGGQKYKSPGPITAEGDWSNSAFWIIGGILPPYSAITCTGLDFHSVQGDKAIVKLAKQFGGQVLTYNDQLRTMSGSLQAMDIDASNIPDLVPILAVAASVAEGTTHIRNAGRLRLKESDRLAAVSDCLNRLGASVAEEPDGLTITGVKRLNGGTVHGYQDHRIVMAMSIASICCDNPVIIEGAEAINKSYPGFFEDFKALGGDVDVV